MAADNEVEIRFRVIDEKTTPAASGPSVSPVSPAQLQPQNYSQRERDSERVINDSVEIDRRFERFEQRLQYSMRRMGARLIASTLAEEIGGIAGVENSFVTRLGASAINGAIIGGAPGAAVRSLMTVVHELINQVKQQGEDVKRLRELQAKRDQENADKFLEFRFQIGEQARTQAEDNQQKIEEFNQHVKDYMENAVRYITVPYTGRG